MRHAEQAEDQFVPIKGEMDRRVRARRKPGLVRRARNAEPAARLVGGGNPQIDRDVLGPVPPVDRSGRDRRPEQPGNAPMAIDVGIAGAFEQGPVPVRQE